MDKHTAEVLRKIGRSIPSEFLKRGIVIERPFQMIQDFWWKRAHDRRFSSKKRDEILRALEIPAIRAAHGRAEVRTDENVSRKIGEFIAAKVDKAIKNGTIKKASMDDPFFRMMREKWKHQPRHDKLTDFKFTPQERVQEEIGTI